MRYRHRLHCQPAADPGQGRGGAGPEAATAQPHVHGRYRRTPGYRTRGPKLADVYLYSVDDLREVIEENMRSRQDAARAAERLIELGTDEFMQRMRARAAVDVLKRYRQQAELQRDQELGKALARLERGGDPAQVMAEMARALTNKLLHEPSVQLKRMSAEGRTESLSLAMELFGLDNETSAQGKQ